MALGLRQRRALLGHRGQRVGSAVCSRSLTIKGPADTGKITAGTPAGTILAVVGWNTEALMKMKPLNWNR